MLNFLKGSFWSLTGTSFNAMMNLSNVLLQRRSREHLGAGRAMLAHIFMNFSDVTLEIRCVEHLRTEGTLFTHIIMNLFDVSR